MERIIDFHSHILPGIDDGSRSPEESLAMLRMLWEQGIRHVVATPHFYPQHDTPEHFLQRRAQAESALRQAMAGQRDLPKVSIGAEVYYFNGISNSDAMWELTIDRTEYLLLEMPMPPWKDGVYRELESLYRKQGLIPIIAHVDRYLGRFRTYGIPERLARLPVLVQANAEFFTKRSTSSMAMRMLRQKQIHLLGSDCHNLSSRSPNLGRALEIIEKRTEKNTLDLIQNWQRRVLPERDHL